jgi:hypothetical protein
MMGRGGAAAEVQRLRQQYPERPDRKYAAIASRAS